MKTKGIEVEVSMSINVGNFQSVKPSIRLQAELEDGDDVTKCHEQLSTQAMALFFREAYQQSCQLDQVTQVGIEQACFNYLSMFNPGS